MMVIQQNASLRLFSGIKKNCAALLLLLCVGLFCRSHCLHGVSITEPDTITYYLYITDFIDSFIEIPTSNVSGGSSTLASSYLAGRAPIYNEKNVAVGTCSASFLSMQNAHGIYTDISNYLSAADGLIVTWFTPTNLINLALDTLVNSMVTECTVVASTKVGFAPLYGQTFDLIVSSDGVKIYFQFSRIDTIF